MIRFFSFYFLFPSRGRMRILFMCPKVSRSLLSHTNIHSNVFSIKHNFYHIPITIIIAVYPRIHIWPNGWNCFRSIVCLFTPYYSKYRVLLLFLLCLYIFFASISLKMGRRSTQYFIDTTKQQSIHTSTNTCGEWETNAICNQINC